MRELKPCGTVAAYMRHIRARELACEPCLAAMSAYTRERRGYQARKPIVCGTMAGYSLHARRKEPRCEACLAARREYEKRVA